MDTYELYQIRDAAAGSQEFIFEGLDRVKRAGKNVEPSNYRKVWSDRLDGMTLDELYEKFNNNHPEGYRGRSMSVSDVVILQINGKKQAYYCDCFGFKPIDFDMTITSKYLFEVIVEQLKNDGRYPEILDYASPNREEVQILTPEFRITGELQYGGSEGIYLDIYLMMGAGKQIPICTFKTLGNDAASMRTMGILLADMISTGTEIVNQNYNWLDRTGYAVSGDHPDGTGLGYRLLADSIEDARQRAFNLHTKDPELVNICIFNKRTREKEVVYA